jgi:hypothetical protein
VDPAGDCVKALTKHFDDQVVKTRVCQTSQRLGAPLTLANDQETTLDTVLKKYLQDNNNNNNNNNPVPDIVILLLRASSQDLYSSFKYLTDKVYVLQSICVTEDKMKPRRDGFRNDAALGQYFANVAMKANLKVAGINHTAQGVDKWLSNTLVLGADVTHPGNGALQGTPSLAAVVTSIEASGGRFRGNIQYQDAKQEVRILGSSLTNSRRWLTRTDHHQSRTHDVPRTEGLGFTPQEVSHQRALLSRRHKR